MDVTSLIRPEQVVSLSTKGKPQLLQELARRAAKPAGIAAPTILRALAAREELGSTGVGRGIALPHATVPGLGRLFSLFARLDKPIDFDAVDGQPVDLVFLLLTPEKGDREHLSALACVSRWLRDEATAARLRATADPRALFEVLAGCASREAAVGRRT